MLAQLVVALNLEMVVEMVFYEHLNIK